MAHPKYPIRSLLRSVVDWIGRRGRPNSPTKTLSCCSSNRNRNTFCASCTSSCTTCATKTDQDLWNMFFTAYCWAGLRYRDPSRLWTGASETKDKEGNTIAPAQVIATDEDGQEAESEQLSATRWLFDKRLKRDMKQVLEQISYSKLIFGKSVQEIEWVKETDGEYSGKLVINDLIDVDPTLFEFNPQGYPPGLYIQKIDQWGIKALSYEQVDERRFLVVTNHLLYDDKNGISELEPLRKPEARREDAEKSWGRGAQRHGHGHILGYYGPTLLGTSAQADRTLYEEALQRLSGDVVTMLYEGNKIESLDVTVDAEVFKELVNEEKSQISLVLTGSTSTFTDSEGGTKARLEASEVAQESEMEIQDCGDISAAITEQLIRRFCNFNWLSTEIYPKMQIINKNIIAPTLPETQRTQTEITEEEGEESVKQEKEIVKESLPTWLQDVDIANATQRRMIDSMRGTVWKLQEEDEKPYTPPVAIPPTYQDFPSTDPLEPDYRDGIEIAQDYLEVMPVKNHPDVRPEEAHRVFTVKRLRLLENAPGLLGKLKRAIIPTLQAENESEAWQQYWKSAIIIFQEYGFEQPSPELRSSLISSFRQARQNALNEGFYQSVLSDPAVIGLRIMNNPNVKQHHATHIFWNNIAIPKEHEELQLGGRLRIPMDFGCVCHYEKIYLFTELTPESEWPKVYPGNSYQFYAQPEPKKEE